MPADREPWPMIVDISDLHEKIEALLHQGKEATSERQIDELIEKKNVIMSGRLIHFRR